MSTSPRCINVAVDTSGVFVSTQGNSSPNNLPLPPPGSVRAWSVSTAPTDSSGGIYISDLASGPTTATQMATLLALGQAIALDVGEALNSPPNAPGPFEFQLSIAAVSGTAQVRLVLWVEQ